MAQNIKCPKCADMLKRSFFILKRDGEVESTHQLNFFEYFCPNKHCEWHNPKR